MAATDCLFAAHCFYADRTNEVSYVKGAAASCNAIVDTTAL